MNHYHSHSLIHNLNRDQTNTITMVVNKSFMTSHKNSWLFLMTKVETQMLEHNNSTHLKNRDPMMSRLISKMRISISQLWYLSNLRCRTIDTFQLMMLIVKMRLDQNWSNLKRLTTKRPYASRPIKKLSLLLIQIFSLCI